MVQRVEMGTEKLLPMPIDLHPSRWISSSTPGQLTQSSVCSHNLLEQSNNLERHEIFSPSLHALDHIVSTDLRGYPNEFLFVLHAAGFALHDIDRRGDPRVLNLQAQVLVSWSQGEAHAILSCSDMPGGIVPTISRAVIR